MKPEADEHSLKKGTAELLVLAQLEDEPRHGYDIALRIEQRSKGAVSFNVASLYPVLYRLESRGDIAGWWVERAGQRRRRFYKLTATGRKKLVQQRRTWSVFMAAVQRAAGLEYA
jgi:transcriptional regulator